MSTKDALIAGEALSLLVTCLQLRSQQLGMEKNWVIQYLEYKPGGRRLLDTVELKKKTKEKLVALLAKTAQAKNTTFH